MEIMDKKFFIRLNLLSLFCVVTIYSSEHNDGHQALERSKEESNQNLTPADILTRERFRSFCDIVFDANLSAEEVKKKNKESKKSYYEGFKKLGLFDPLGSQSSESTLSNSDEDVSECIKYLFSKRVYLSNATLLNLLTKKRRVEYFPKDSLSKKDKSEKLKKQLSEYDERMAKRLNSWMLSKDDSLLFKNNKKPRLKKKYKLRS